MIVIYTDRFIRKEWIAMNCFLFILIRPKYKGVKFVLEHEKVHTRQVWKYLIFQPILYNLSKKWRLKFELEAYKVGIKYGQSLYDASWALSNTYGLGISQSHAAVLLAKDL